VGYTFGKENVPSISAIHHSLRDVNPSAGDIGSAVNINQFVDRAAVDSHPDTQFGLRFQPLAQFQGTSSRGFWTSPKDQCHAVASRQTNELAFRVGDLDLFRCEDNRCQLSE